MPTVSNVVNIPVANTYPTPTYAFNSPKANLFSECLDPNDAMSMMVANSDPLMQWIPATSKNTWNENIGHLSYTIPEGFDGSKSYIDFNRGKAVIEDCNYAPAGMEMSTCEYSLPMYRFTFSNSDKPLKPGSRGGIDYCNTTPRFAMRGEFAGLQFQTDEAWVLSGLTTAAENHMRNVLRFGSGAFANTGNGEYDGLLEILTEGYVASKKVGDGECRAEDPLVINANAKTSATSILRLLRDVVRKIYTRHRNMGYMPRFGDLAIVMHPEMWAFLAEEAATLQYLNTTYENDAFRVNAQDEAWIRRYIEMTTSGPFMAGVFQMPGYVVPIIPDDLMGVQTTEVIENVETPVMKGRILVLSREHKGINLLEHQWINWNQVPMPNYVDTDVLMDGKWLQSYEVASTCWHMNLEGAFRLVTRMQRLQARIEQVTLPIRGDVTYESNSMLSKEFFAYEDALAHAGVPVLNPNIPS